MPSFSDSPAASFKGRFSRRTVLLNAALIPTVGVGAAAAAASTPTELPVGRVNRLAEELAHAMDEGMASISHPDYRRALWVAHVWPASSERGIYFRNENAAVIHGSCGSLSDLMAAHTVALAAWDAVPDQEWDTQQAHLSAEVDRTRDALLEHRPSTMAEVHTKAEYMASVRSFHQWDDFDRIKLIEALTPVGV